MEPLANLVNFFKDPNLDKSRLEFACCHCPMLLRDSIFELFPVRAIGQRDYAITLLTLSYEGDIEQGAAKVSHKPHIYPSQCLCIERFYMTYPLLAVCLGRSGDK